jgi:hypothetical protein
MDGIPSSLIHMAIAGQVYNGPCFLLSMGVSSTGASKVVTVYDGRNASGRKMLLYNLATTGPFERRFARPVLFESGIYVDFTDTAASADFEVVPAVKGILQT